MACCGRGTAPTHATLDRTSGSAGHGERPDEALPARREVLFEYVGARALTVFGPYTGRRYRFPRSGSTLGVHVFDAPSLTAVPNLRQVHTRTPPR